MTATRADEVENAIRQLRASLEPWVPPTYYHPGGDWWISAMRELWYWVAHLAARDAELGVVRPPPAPCVLAPGPRATGGNEPRKSVGNPYIKPATA